MGHYLDFFIESTEVAETKVAVADERVIAADREACEAKVWALEVGESASGRRDMSMLHG